jgi:hypothetical protein
VIHKRTGNIIYNGGKDVVVNKVSHAKTDIVDTGKDYILNFWIKKPEWYGGQVNSVSKFQKSGHRIGKKKDNVKTKHQCEITSPKIKTANRFRMLDEDEQFATF